MSSCSVAVVTQLTKFPAVSEKQVNHTLLVSSSQFRELKRQTRVSRITRLKMSIEGKTYKDTKWNTKTPTLPLTRSAHQRNVHELDGMRNLYKNPLQELCYVTGPHVKPNHGKSTHVTESKNIHSQYNLDSESVQHRGIQHPMHADENPRSAVCLRGRTRH